MYAYYCLSYLGNGIKLDRCVSTVVLGYQCIDDTVKNSQVIFRDGEKKQNFFVGERTALVEYVLDHFCPPGGTVLDMTCDPSGMHIVFAFTVCDVIPNYIYYPWLLVD